MIHRFVVVVDCALGRVVVLMR